MATGGIAAAGCTVPLLRRSDEGAASTTSSSSSSSSSSSTSAPASRSSSATVPATTSSTSSTSSRATTAGDVFGMGDLSTEHLTITVADGYRTIASASYPDWAIDTDFRYPATPAVSDLAFRVTTKPQVAAKATQVRTGQVFGVMLNSVVFDPATAEYYQHARNGAWNETPRALDSHGCHTRQGGFYHCHTITKAWVSDPTAHSALVAWAADGFPVYLRYGYTDPTDPGSGVTNLRSSYRLTSGSRPSGSGNPGGTYDGTYVADYEYVEGLGDLDECGGRQCVTPEFPNGTYAYFLTDTWPSVPSWLRGTPDASFAPGNGGGSGKPPS